MNQPFHAAQINKHTEVGDVGDHAANGGVGREGLEQHLPAALTGLRSPFRQHDPLLCGFALDHFQLQRLADVTGEDLAAFFFILGGRHFDQVRNGHEPLNPLSLYEQSPPIVPVHGQGDDLILFV